MAYRDSEHERLEAEVARLRETLKAIARRCVPALGGHSCALLVDILLLARDALGWGVE